MYRMRFKTWSSKIIILISMLCIQLKSLIGSICNLLDCISLILFKIIFKSSLCLQYHQWIFSHSLTSWYYDLHDSFKFNDWILRVKIRLKDFSNSKESSNKGSFNDCSRLAKFQSLNSLTEPVSNQNRKFNSRWHR